MEKYTTRPRHDRYQNQNSDIIEIQRELEAQEMENQRLKGLLSSEQAKVDRFQKKLQYIQDNQDMFTKLKQAYVALKTTKSIPKKDFSVQTCDPEKCVPIECASRDPDCCNRTCTIQKTDLTEIISMVKILEAQVKEDAERLTNAPKFDTEKRNEFRYLIEELGEENTYLKLRLEQATIDLEDIKVNTGGLDPKENLILRKLCAKMATLIMDEETTDQDSEASLHKVLSEKESRLVTALMNKYDKKNDSGRYSRRSLIDSEAKLQKSQKRSETTPFRSSSRTVGKPHEKKYPPNNILKTNEYRVQTCEYTPIVCTSCSRPKTSREKHDIHEQYTIRAHSAHGSPTEEQIRNEHKCSACIEKGLKHRSSRTDSPKIIIQESSNLVFNSHSKYKHSKKEISPVNKRSRNKRPTKTPPSKSATRSKHGNYETDPVSRKFKSKSPARKPVVSRSPSSEYFDLSFEPEVATEMTSYRTAILGVESPRHSTRSSYATARGSFFPDDVM